ncbi:MAG: tol-pal system protein YbgF [Gemmatimonadetes bacterium]|nr:tol-pal system protein YbgF [Gemmatimonadota bacterium]
MTLRTNSAAARVCAMAALVTLGGCATKSDIRDLQVELRALAARQDSVLAEMRLGAVSTQDTLRTQADQLFDFRGDVTRQLRLVVESLSRLEALAGENQRGLVGVRDQLTNLRRQTGSSQAGPGDDGSEGATGGAPAGGDAQQLYRTASDLRMRGSLTTARMAFQQFLDNYPNHELAPAAQFFLADILDQQNEREGALEAFRAIQERFPTADKVPDALYRIALIQIDQEDTEAAVATLERIINTYPDTIMAELAAEKLDEIR